MIVERTPAAAREALRAALQQAISRVTSAVLTVESDAVETRLGMTTRLARTTVRDPITLSIRYTVALVHAADAAVWQTRTTGYMYTLDDADGREILAYHWHPAGRSHVTTPHLHLGAGAGLLRSELQKAHLLTGLVTSAALLTLLVEQFDIRPRRAEWAATLARADEALRQT